jgi:hypothetical protein
MWIRIYFIDQKRKLNTYDLIGDPLKKKKWNYLFPQIPLPLFSFFFISQSSFSVYIYIIKIKIWKVKKKNSHQSNPFIYTWE